MAYKDAVLERIKPGPEEEALLKRAAGSVRAALESAIGDAGVHADIVPGGSYAKGTWLSESRDVDLFVRFEREADLERLGGIVRAAFPDADEVQGSRPYYRLVSEGIEFEIVPALRLEHAGEARNTMDMSPFHVSYVQDHLTSPDDVRLLKRLLQAKRLYGAESHVRGLSGYSCELLVITYGGFSQALEAIAGWDEEVVVDPAAHYPEGDARERIDPAKRTRFVLIDPTDRARNVAAALSSENYDALRTIARSFLDDPSEAQFESGDVTLDPPYHEIVMTGSKDKPDIAAAQLRHVHDRLVRILEDFGVTTAAWTFNEAAGSWTSMIALEREELPDTIEIIGPPVEMEGAAAAFRAAHPDTEERDGRLVAKAPQKITTLDATLESFFASPGIASRTSGYAHRRVDA